MIPALDNRGLLPPGIHRATWAEVLDYFDGDVRRTSLLTRSRSFAQVELARDFGACPLLLAGSVFSDLPRPDDIESAIMVRVADLTTSTFRAALRLQGQHDNFKERLEIDFYVSLDIPGAEDFSEYFQYVGEKTAAIKHLAPKDKRGIVEVAQWIHG